MSALSNVVRCLAKVKFKAIKHAPELFMYAGIAGTVVATVDACKRTSNMPKILDEHEEAVEELKEKASETPMNEYRKEMAKIYASTSIKVVRNYALPAAMGLISVGSILYGHRILKRRYVQTSIALSAMTKDYNNLYDNLVQEVGEEKAKEIKAGVVTEEIEEVVTDEKGKEKTVKKTVKKLGDKGSQYTLKWNEDTADEWVKDFEQNYLKVYSRVECLKNNIAVRETHHLFWWEAIEFLFGSRGLKTILKDRESKGLPNPMLAGWIYDYNSCSTINVDFIADPDDPYGILITLIPDGNITEFGKGKDGLKAIEAA